MFLIFCFSIIFIGSYYARKYLKWTSNQISERETSAKRIKLKSKYKMSDDEFVDPKGAQKRWSNVNVNSPPNLNVSSMFRWKRALSNDVNVEIEQNKKRKKKLSNESDSAIAVIEITDDETDLSVSESSLSTVEPKLTTDDSKSSIIVNSKSKDPSPQKLLFDESNKEKVDAKWYTNYLYTEKLEKAVPKWKQAPIPPGMPPVIAGIPIKFPITPYKSQISVMNAVVKGCKNSEHCLLESPTGSGKTLALLCAALAWQSHFDEMLSNSYSDDIDFNSEKITFKDKKKEKNIHVPRIFYGSRTHKQIAQVIREFKKTAYRDKPMTILSSRELTCLQPSVKGVSKTQICNDLRDPVKKKGCQFYMEKNKMTIATNTALDQCGMETPWDIEDLVELGKQHSACPYFAARSLMQEASIIFCPYNYLLDPTVRDTMQIKLDGDIVIIDEGHNIESICRDVGSADFREDYLGEAIEDCQLNYNLLGETNLNYHIIKVYLQEFVNIMQDQPLQNSKDQYEEVTSTCWTGEDVWVLLALNKLGDDRYIEFKASCTQVIADYNQVKEDMVVGKMDANINEGQKKKKQPSITFSTKKLLEEMLLALENIQSPIYKKDYRCTISQAFHSDAKVKLENNVWTSGQGGRRLRTFKFMSMNAAIVFSVVASKARSVIVASGTLSPTSTFESELGTNFPHKLHANHVVPKEQVYVRGIAAGPKGTVLRATYQNVQSLPFKDDLGRLVYDVCQTVPHGVLCFFSSYTMMTSQIERWEETGVWYELQRCKRILKEPRSNYDLDEIMNEYREIIRDTADGPSHCGITGALLFAVFRGKVAEGIDFSDNEARAVLTIGIPYAVQNDPCVKLKREYNDQNRTKGLLSGSEWYTVQAYRALNQALGRCIRHRNDWGAVLLVDERLLTSNSAGYLPKWIREMRREELNYNLKEELKEFVKQQQARDKERN